MWAQILNAILGVWLMVAPAVLHYEGALRTNDRIVGPLVAACAIIALWPVMRPVRWVNVMLGVWLIVAPWLFGVPRPVLLHSVGVGFLIMGFASVRGTISHRFDGGWAMLWSSNIRTPSPPQSSISHYDSDARPPG